LNIVLTNLTALKEIISLINVKNNNYYVVLQINQHLYLRKFNIYLPDFNINIYENFLSKMEIII
jgi:predicted CDP-diglyceride synthetase/phosphatidate cytidylyltransferase